MLSGYLVITAARDELESHTVGGWVVDLIFLSLPCTTEICPMKRKEEKSEIIVF